MGKIDKKTADNYDQMVKSLVQRSYLISDGTFMNPSLTPKYIKVIKLEDFITLSNAFVDSIKAKKNTSKKKVKKNDRKAK